MKAVLLPVAVVLMVLGAPPALAQDAPPSPPFPRSVEVSLKVQRDGSLSVTESVSVPQGTTMTRHVALRTPAGHARDRVLGVRDVSIEGAGSSQLDEDQLTLRFGAGISTARYTVDGVVSAGDGFERVAWPVASGWDGPLEFVQATFAAPRIPDALTCAAGPDGSDTQCGAAQIDHSGLTRVTQQNLPAGQRIALTVELRGGTVPVTEDLEPAKTLSGAFVATTPVFWAWGAFALLLALAAAGVWLLRRRDAEAGEPLPAVLLQGEETFASPEGILPGHAGVLLSGRVDALDLAATVLDLAVRNYLWVEEGDGDWTLTARNPADEHLAGFERALYTALLPGEDGSVRLSELRSGVPGEVRAALAEDVVAHGWFRRPGRVSRAGLRICAYGVFLTVLLALTVGYAQLGLVLLAIGVTLAAGARWLPARTATGGLLRRQLLGVRDELAGTKPADVPKPARTMVFSRALPYALALGETERWVRVFGARKRPPEVYWYGPPEGEDVDFARVAGFAAALAGVFAAAEPGARRRAVLSRRAPVT